LVELYDQGETLNIDTDLLQVVSQVFECIGIVVLLSELRIRDEDYPIGPGQNSLSGAVMLDLARHGIQLETQLQATLATHAYGQHVEEQGAVVAGFQDHELTLALRLQQG